MNDDAGSGGVVGLQVQVGKLEERVAGIDRNLGSQIENLSKQLVAALAEFRAGYATVSALDAVKGDVAAVTKRVDGLWSSIGWGVKIVVGAVVAGLIGLLFAKGGVPRP